jgi:potassium-transporting ATPase KdpC subunit
MTAILRAALTSTLLLMLLTGVVYPAAITGLCQLALRSTADGSLLRRADGSVLGSALIGQSFSQPRFFWGRPSSAGKGYDPQASSPSNLATTSRKLAESFATEADKARTDGMTGPLPVDRLTGSGSGLDPDISEANALGQAARVARARGLPEARVVQLVEARLKPRDLGLFGEPRVNVLELNLALHELPGQLSDRIQ